MATVDDYVLNYCLTIGFIEVEIQKSDLMILKNPEEMVLLVCT